jgi:hypothetical protein
MKRDKSAIKKFNSSIFPQSLVPWRVTNTMELLLEKLIRQRIPVLYSLIHFGWIRNIFRPMTRGPGHHFFGYYDKSPWNLSQKFLLTHEVSFNDRPPAANDAATIGLVRLSNGNDFIPLSKTYAWNWQQGSLLQWHPGDPENLFVFNDRRSGQFVGIVQDVTGKEVRVYDLPFYAISPDGKFALTLNFSRLHEKRPGYGYAGIPDPWSEANHPEDDGVYVMNLETGRHKLIISLHQLALNYSTQDLSHLFHWVNHIQINPGGTRFAFLHRWENIQGGFSTRLYTSDFDGTNLYCLLDGGMVSHYDWMDNETLLAWARLDYRKDSFILCHDQSTTNAVIGEGILTEDGHCSFSPDRKWILTDSYPDKYQLRSLMLFRMEDQKKIELARLFSPKSLWGEIRCDLHPRWNRNGRQICFDSVHTGERQMYIADVEKIIN